MTVLAMARWFGAFLGWCAYHVLRVRRGVVHASLAAAFPKWSAAERGRVAREVYRQLGAGVGEFLCLATRAGDGLLAGIEVRGEEHLQAALAHHRGALVLSAHIGAFELLGPWFAARGHRCALIGRPVGKGPLPRLWGAVRARRGVRVLPPRGAMADLFEELRAGGLVGFVLDQHVSARRGVRTPFLGREASTMTALALIARRTGAPVVPVWSRREGERLVIEVEPPLAWLETGAGRDADALANTRHYSQVMERWVRAYPEQWLWLHRRWK